MQPCAVDLHLNHSYLRGIRDETPAQTPAPPAAAGRCRRHRLFCVPPICRARSSGGYRACQRAAGVCPHGCGQPVCGAGGGNNGERRAVCGSGHGVGADFFANRRGAAFRSAGGQGATGTDGAPRAGANRGATPAAANRADGGRQRPPAVPRQFNLAGRTQHPLGAARCGAGGGAGGRSGAQRSAGRRGAGAGENGAGVFRYRRFVGARAAGRAGGIPAGRAGQRSARRRQGGKPVKPERREHQPVSACAHGKSNSVGQRGAD